MTNIEVLDKCRELPLYGDVYIDNDHLFWYFEDIFEDFDYMHHIYCEDVNLIREIFSGTEVLEVWNDNNSCGFKFLVK